MKTLIANALALVLGIGLICGCANGQPPPIPAQEQPEVLTRGPVHEAFSEPVILQNQEGLVVPSEPPGDIDEVLPEDRPQGDQFVWVPGYWSWDGDRNNFIWVSGCWRAAPPNMSWMPGYWSKVSGGWQWVAGLWTPADTKDMEYLPPPPRADNDDSRGPSPSQNDIWVPSCPYWEEDHYIDRPGYWLEANQDWVWTPSHYVWTPRGYIFCDGHWDYPLENRGVLFAPVYFPQSIYSRPGYSYSPSIVIDLGVLSVNLFTYPRYSHYYFGDYYDDAYLNVGIYPRDDVDRVHTWYDPTYVYDRWHHRDQPGWAANERRDYDARHADRNLRPARTYHEMESRQTSSSPEQQRNVVRIAAPLTVVVARKETSIKFAHVDANTQQTISKQTTAVRTFRAERNRWESSPVTNEAVQPPTEQKGRVAQPAPQKNPARTKAQGTVTSPQPPDRKQQATQPQATKTQPQATGNQPAQQAPARMTRPQRVQVPAAPIVRRQVATEKSPPPRPVSERKYQNAVKVAPKDVQHQGKPTDKSKDKGSDKGGDKTNDKGK